MWVGSEKSTSTIHKILVVNQAGRVQKTAVLSVEYYDNKDKLTLPMKKHFYFNKLQNNLLDIKKPLETPFIKGYDIGKFVYTPKHYLSHYKYRSGKYTVI